MVDGLLDLYLVWIGYYVNDCWVVMVGFVLGCVIGRSGIFFLVFIYY